MDSDALELVAAILRAGSSRVALAVAPAVANQGQILPEYHFSDSDTADMIRVHAEYGNDDEDWEVAWQQESFFTGSRRTLLAGRHVRNARRDDEERCLGNVVAFFIINIILIVPSVQYLLQIYLESKLLDCWLCL